MNAHRTVCLACALVLGSGSVASAVVVTSFDEGVLNPNVGLDIPNAALASISLDTVNNELDMLTNGNTDLWTARNNAPIAWTLSPPVGLGQTWYVETEVRNNGAANGAQRVTGLLFYQNVDGTGGSNDGMDFSYGINDWNDRSVEVQGLGGTQVGDSGVSFINALADIGNVASAFLRVEVTEAGVSDHYVMFYKLNGGDPWTQLTEFNSTQDNSRVGLFFKNGSSTAPADRSVSFTYFEVAPVIPEPSTFVLAVLGMLALAGYARRRKR